MFSGLWRLVPRLKKLSANFSGGGGDCSKTYWYYNMVRRSSKCSVGVGTICIFDWKWVPWRQLPTRSFHGQISELLFLYSLNNIKSITTNSIMAIMVKAQCKKVLITKCIFQTLLATGKSHNKKAFYSIITCMF